MENLYLMCASHVMATDDPVEQMRRCEELIEELKATTAKLGPRGLRGAAATRLLLEHGPDEGAVLADMSVAGFNELTYAWRVSQGGREA